MEVHDCCSITKLVTMAVLHIFKQGQGRRDVLVGGFDADEALPCHIDGGLKCFGQPIGASGLHMTSEKRLQLLAQTAERQRENRSSFGLSHNLGGMPNQNGLAVAIVGLMGA